MSVSKVWFITGASRGFGRTWTEAALARGDSVAAGVRDTGSVADLRERHGDNLLPVRLDVTEKSQAEAGVEQAVEQFGRIDVLVNNAGYCLAGALEEVEEAEARKLFDTNLFGALWTTQAVLPVMRTQNNGHIISVSSVSGLMGQPTIGIYNASKWALEGLMDSLAQEVSGLGVKVSILEPAVFATEFTSPASIRFSPTKDVYDGARARLYESLATEVAADPRSTIAQIFSLVDDPHPPLRLLLGESALRWAERANVDRQSSWSR